jgi:hypothetical protein
MPAVYSHQMAITAIALLRIRAEKLALDRSLRVVALEDAVLLHTRENFASEPDALSARVRDLLGSSLIAAHTDPRGIFFIPDVASPKARTYDGVLDEVGEGGVWGHAMNSPAGGLPLGLDGGALGALLGQIPSSIMQAVGDAARGDEGALQSASAQLQALLGSSGEFRALAGQLASSLGQLAPATTSTERPNLQQLVANMREELESDPTRLTHLAEQLLGGSSAQAPDEDES